MKKNLEATDPREVLRRLIDALDEDLPDDEEGREAVASMGVDVDALAARIQARVAAHAAANDREGVAPQTHRDAPAAAPAIPDPAPEEAASEAPPSLVTQVRGRKARLALAAGLLMVGTAAAVTITVRRAAPHLLAVRELPGVQSLLKLSAASAEAVSAPRAVGATSSPAPLLSTTVPEK